MVDDSVYPAGNGHADRADRPIYNEVRVIKSKILAISTHLKYSITRSSTLTILCNRDSCPAEAGGGGSRRDLDHPAVRRMVDLVNENRRVAAADHRLVSGPLQRERVSLNVGQRVCPGTGSGGDHNCRAVGRNLVQCRSDVSLVTRERIYGLCVSQRSQYDKQ